MEEHKKQENMENLDAESLDQVTGGAILFEALDVARSIHKGQEKKGITAEDSNDKLAEKKSALFDKLDDISHGAAQVMERLDRMKKADK